MVLGAAVEDKIPCALFEVFRVVEVVGLGVPRLGPLTSIRVGAVLLVGSTILILPPDGVDVRGGLHALRWLVVARRLERRWWSCGFPGCVIDSHCTSSPQARGFPCSNEVREHDFVVYVREFS